MFSVSAEIYEVLSLALRYVFTFLGVLIVLRTWVRLLSDRRERHRRLRHLPDAGMIGEFVVLAGSRDLPAGTRLSVPREGVLGSLRSCDLVVPCEGVKSNHLDFSWVDGTGLLISPRSRCEAFVNQVPLSCRTDPLSAPLRSGSLLQVGGATLRLLTFVGLDASLPEDAVSDGPGGSGTPPDPGMVPAPGMIPAPFEPQACSSVPEAPFREAIDMGPAIIAQQPSFSPQHPAADDPSFSLQSAPPFSDIRESAFPLSEPQQALPCSDSTDAGSLLSEPQSGGSGSASQDRFGEMQRASRLTPPSPSPARRRRSDRWKEDWSE